MANKDSRIIHWGVMQKLVVDSANVVHRALTHVITREEAYRQLLELEKQAFTDDPIAEPDGEITYTIATARERLDTDYHCPTHNDTERVEWLEKHPNISFTYHDKTPFTPYWRKTWGPKSAANRFKTLREAIDADIDGKIR